MFLWFTTFKWIINFLRNMQQLSNFTQSVVIPIILMPLSIVIKKKCLSIYPKLKCLIHLKEFDCVHINTMKFSLSFFLAFIQKNKNLYGFQAKFSHYYYTFNGRDTTWISKNIAWNSVGSNVKENQMLNFEFYKYQVVNLCTILTER